jgi:hypothetical protein
MAAIIMAMTTAAAMIMAMTTVVVMTKLEMVKRRITRVPVGI